MSNTPVRFISWAGSKKQSLQYIIDRMPNKYTDYYEPFLGGGSIFFNISDKEMIKHNVHLSDINEELIYTYSALKNHLYPLIENLYKLNDEYQSYDMNGKEKMYYRLRDIYNNREKEILSQVEEASIFIFLNKTCFNGLYRVNKKGKFNVNFGKRENPYIINESELKICSKKLSKVSTLRNMDFRHSLSNITSGSFVYMDPPIFPITKSAKYTSYTSKPFTIDDHIAVARIANILAKNNNCKVMISNIDTPEVRKIFSNFNITKVITTRKINSSKSKKRTIDLIITTY